MKFSLDVSYLLFALVSTLVVEWIEIAILNLLYDKVSVSTLVVEWIEMPSGATYMAHSSGLHPRGGVD